MVCNEVRDRLSEYLDGVLPIETKTRVDDHLSVCAGCRKELDSLKAVVRELNTLHQVDPPDDFLEQLHGRMTARPWHQRVIRSLFLPLRFKIPIQVAGALTAALLVFSILTLQQDERDRLLRPSVAPAPPPTTFPETGNVVKRPVPTQAPAAPTRAGSKADVEKIRREQKTAPSEKLTADEATRIGAMALVLRIPRNRFAAAPNKAFHKVEPEGAQFRIKKEGPVDPLVHELKALAARHQGHVLTAVYDEGSGRLDSVEIEIPSSQYGAFSEGLKALGDIEPSEPVPELVQGPLKLSIKVIVSGT
jgi:hypothetical protein